MAPIWKPGSGTRSQEDGPESGTDLDITVDESFASEGQELQWIDSDDDKTVASIVKRHKSRFASIFRKSKKNYLASRVVVLPTEEGESLVDWDENQTVDRIVVWPVDMHEDAEITSLADDGEGLEIAESLAHRGSDAAKNRRFVRSKKGTTKAPKKEGVPGPKGAAAIAVLPKKHRPTGDASKKNDGKSIQYFQAQVITINHERSHESCTNSDEESIKAFEKINERLHRMDEESLDSLGARYRKPVSPPRLKDQASKQGSPNRPTFVTAPRLDARVLTAHSWNSLLTGGSLASILSQDEDNTEPAMQGNDSSLDGSFLARRAKSVKNIVGSLRRRRRKKIEEDYTQQVLIHVRSSNGVEEVEAEPPVLLKPDETFMYDEGLFADDGSALTMDEALITPRGSKKKAKALKNKRNIF